MQHRRLQSGFFEQRRQRGYILGNFTRRLTQREAIAVDMADHARRFDLGRRIDDATNGALRAEFLPLAAAGIDALQRGTFARIAVLVEVPVGNAVHGSNNARLRPEQRLHRIDHTGDRMRFQTDDDDILHAEIGGIIGTARICDPLFAIDQKFETVGFHRRQMRAARHQADVSASQRELHAEIAANRARTVDADLHRFPRNTGLNKKGRTLSHVWELHVKAPCRENRQTNANSAGRAAGCMPRPKLADALMSRMLITPTRV